MRLVFITTFRRALLGALALTVCGQAQTIQSVLNAASYSTAVAPYTWVAVFGTQLAPSTLGAASAPFPVSLNGVSVKFGGVAAPLAFVSSGQINALVAVESASPPAGQTATVPVVVTTPSGISAPFSLTLQATAPAVYTKDVSGSGAALAFDAGFNQITTVGTSPIVLYATGLGPTNPPAATGALGGLNTVTSSVSVTIGGTAATILYAGLAPGLHGIYQINVMPGAPVRGNSLVLVAGGFFEQRPHAAGSGGDKRDERQRLYPRLLSGIRGRCRSVRRHGHLGTG